MTLLQMTLPETRAEIEKRIPHAGAMCLLEKVIHYDAAVIRCETTTHQDLDNPLRNANGLPVSAALEYAAQAAAVHGNLLQAGSEVPRGGYLAVLTHVQWQPWLYKNGLHTIAAPLCVDVRRDIETAGGIDCTFSIFANTGAADKDVIVSGSMVVAFIGVD